MLSGIVTPDAELAAPKSPATPSTVSLMRPDTFENMQCRPVRKTTSRG
jgi:hypothetical protein